MYISPIFGREGVELRRQICAYFAENLVDSAGAERAASEYVFVAGDGVEFYDAYACRLLTAVVLFLHQEIEAVEGVGVGAVFAFVVFKGLQEPYERYAAFVFELFHLYQRMKRSSRYFGRGHISLSTMSSSLSMW